MSKPPQDPNYWRNMIEKQKQAKIEEDQKREASQGKKFAEREEERSQYHPRAKFDSNVEYVQNRDKDKFLEPTEKNTEQETQRASDNRVFDRYSAMSQEQQQNLEQAHKDAIFDQYAPKKEQPERDQKSQEQKQEKDRDRDNER